MEEPLSHRSPMPGCPCWLPARAVIPKLTVRLRGVFMTCQPAARSNLILAEELPGPRCFFPDDKELIEKQITMMAAQAPLINLPAPSQCE